MEECTLEYTIEQWIPIADKRKVRIKLMIDLKPCSYLKFSIGCVLTFWAVSMMLQHTMEEQRIYLYRTFSFQFFY